MKRQGKGNTPAKRQRHKLLTRRNAPNASGHREKTNSVRLAGELYEAREQQRATAEILRVIRASPTDALPVFETIVQNAVSLCGGLFANVFRFDGERLHFVASHNVVRHDTFGAAISSRRHALDQGCDLGDFHGKPLHSFGGANDLACLHDTISISTQTEIVGFSAVSIDAKEAARLSTRAGS